MPTARKLGLVLLSPLFIFLLFATAFDIGFTKTATHPDVVKKLVAQSGIYGAVVPNVLSQVKGITTPFGDISTDDPAVRRAVGASLPPMFIQENTELAIDNVYQWLDGKIAQPNFKIDLGGAKTLFANNIADSLQKRLASLPACSLSQSRNIIASGSFDAVNATCLPAGVTAAAVAEQVKTAIVSQQDFLKTTSVNASSIKDSNGRSVFEQPAVKDIPVQYRRAKKAPLILSLLTIICGLGIIFLSASWQKGLRHVGINLLIIGFIMLAFAGALNRTMSTNVIPKIKVDNAILQQDLRSLITGVAKRIDGNYKFFGGLYVALGAVGVTVAQIAIRRQGPGNPSSKGQEAPAPLRRQTERPAAPPKPKAG